MAYIQESQDQVVWIIIGASRRCINVIYKVSKDAFLFLQVQLQW